MNQEGMWYRDSQRQMKCLSMAVWQKLAGNDRAGIVGGKTSDGKEVICRFVVKADADDNIKYLFLEDREVITGKVVSFDTIAARVLPICEKAKAQALALHMDGRIQAAKARAKGYATTTNMIITAYLLCAPDSSTRRATRGCQSRSHDRGGFPPGTRLGQKSGHCALRFSPLRSIGPSVKGQDTNLQGSLIGEEWVMNRKSTSQRDSSSFLVNAAWEPSDGSMRCRWFVAWKLVGENQIAGSIAGFSGGGAFQVEGFWGVLEGGKFTQCWIDDTDHVTKKDVDFSSLPESIQELCYEAYEFIWEWNDSEKWNDFDGVYLRPEHEGKLTERDGMWRLETDQFPGIIKALCSYAGLTARPLV